MSAPSPARQAGSLTWMLAALLAGFSILTVYQTSMTLHVMDMGTRIVYDAESLKHYREALDGARAFPYQWRLLGVYLVRGIEIATGMDPNRIDIGVKVVLLWCSSALLLAFSRRYVSAMGALCGVALYFVLTAAGFTDGYSIYYTNDYVMLACWFGAALMLRQGRVGMAALLTFTGAFAKETMMLVPILAGFEWLRHRGSLKAVVWTGIAFVVPTVILRWTYQAPVQEWAWWQMAYTNVPFLQPNTGELMLTLKNNVKVALFFNILWVLAALAVRRKSEPFVKSLALTMGVYILMAYPVIYIRELRHFLPLAILILPMAIQELERRAAAADPAP
jgi:hypothetical protein